MIPTCAAKARIAAAILAAAVLPACMLPVHPSAPNDVTVRSVGLVGHTRMCTSGVDYRVPEQLEDGFRSSRLPAGKQLTVSRVMSFQGYNVTSTCTPALAFTPAEGKQYVINAGLVDGKCFIELVREDANTESGVAFEDSLAQPSC
jgi:hypothetical protein